MTAPRIPDGGSLYDQYLQSKQGDGGGSLYDQYQRSKQTTKNPGDFRNQRESTSVTPAGDKTSSWGDTIREAASNAFPLAKGATANFADEMAGIIGAATQGSTYTGSAAKNYTASRKDYQKSENQYAEKHPIANVVGQLAGGILPTVASDGATLTGQLGLKGIGSAAAEGAAWGGLSGVGAGDGIGDRATKGLKGGLLGGILGGGIATAAKGTGAATGGIKSLLTSQSTKAATAADLALAKQADTDVGLQGLIDRARSDKAAGAEPLIATSGGKGVNDLTWLGVNTPSPQRQQLVDALEHSRSFERPMLEANLEDAASVSPTSAYKAGQAIDRQKDISSHQLYSAAEAEAPIHDPEIVKRIIQEPELVNAMARTVKSFGESATPEDLKAVQSMAYARNLLDTNPNANIDALVQPIPVRLLNEMKKGTDDLVDNLAAKDQNFTRMDANRIRSAMSDILNRADTQRPSFGNARTVFGNDAGRLNAMEEGGNLLQKRPEQIADELGGSVKMGLEGNHPQTLLPQHTPDYKVGGVDAIKQQLAEKAKTKLPNFTGQVFGEGEPIDRVHSLLGEEGSQQFEPALDAAKRFEATYNRALGGSSTEGNRSVKEAVDDFTHADLLKLIESPKRAVFGFLSKLSGQQRDSFKQALAGELATRLATDPTGAAGTELVKRLQATLDKTSVTQIAVQAQRAAKQMRLVGRVSGSALGVGLGGGQ